MSEWLVVLLIYLGIACAVLAFVLTVGAIFERVCAWRDSRWLRVYTKRGRA